MIDWIIDRVWAWKNSAALAQVDRDLDALDVMRVRLDAKMLEAFGPDWRQEGERRVAKLLSNVRYDWT